MERSMIEVSHVDHEDDNDHSEVRPVFMFMMMMLITVMLAKGAILMRNFRSC